MHTAIVVPGHAVRGRISSLCLELVREAERIATDASVDVVVFTGWAPRGGESEAEQMRAAWRGPNVELVLERTARVTVENAVRTLPLLAERGIGRALVVCAPLHLYRARYFFTRVYASRGIASEFRTIPTGRNLRALLWELGAATAVRRHLRAARTELKS
jgi:uncharacterized SAM-binding protein YcdF (DUF218 family)